MGERLTSEPTTLVVVLSQDQSLARVLPARLEQLSHGVEVQIVRSLEALRTHLKKLRPDVTVLDAALALRDGLAEGDRELFLQSPLVIVGSGVDDDIQHRLALTGDDVTVVGKSPTQMEEVAAAVARVSRALIETSASSPRLHYDILEATSDGVFVLIAGVFRYVNEAFATTLGAKAEALVDIRGLVDFVVADDKERVTQELDRVETAGGRREMIEMTLLDNRGRVARCEVACRSSVVDGRRAIVGVARDITAEHQLQKEIENSRRRAAQVERLRALGELAAGVAHDFNNTLGTILGRVILTRQKLARGESIDDDLSVIEVAGRSASAVVQRIQEFSRPAGTDTWQDVDLEAVVRDSCDFVRTRVPKSVKLELDVRSTPHIQGNGAELREVLLNLLRNALDAVDEGGTVAIRCFEDEGKAVIVVEDNGHGMPEAVQQRIFEPFFTTKAERGTGLGLSVSHWILRRHDAQIQLKSEPGQGTVFRLVFAPLLALRRAATKLDKEALSILVVDDDQTVAEMMRDLLQEHGHNVAVVTHPSEAAQALGARRTDLLITDLDLPGISGWQLARKVREIQPDILVGIITGWAVGTSEAELSSRGVDFVLAKPFTIEALQGALSKATGRG